MSLKIERRGPGFRVRLEGDRGLYVAPDAHGVAQAVLHYYAAPHEEGRCPLCPLDAAQGPSEPDGPYTVEEHPAWVDDYRHLVLDRAGAVVARCCEARRAHAVARALNALGPS